MSLLRIICVWLSLLISSIRMSEDIKFELVNVGKSIELSCDLNNFNFIRLTWSYKQYGTNTEIVIYSMNENKYWRNYEAFCQPKAQFCNITLLHAREESAGRYWCKIATRRGQARFIACTIEVVVGEMKCHSNINHSVIGENDCPGLKAYDHIMERFCSLNYYGNPNLAFRFNWIGRNKNNKTVKETPIRRNTIKLGENNVKSILHQGEILAENFINGITYECHIENNLSFDSCSLPTLEVEYVRFPSQRQVNITINNFVDTICYVEKSENVKCSYFWKFESVGVNTSKINSSILTTNDIQSSGLYTCTAICQLGNSKECNITAVELCVIPTESSENYKKTVIIVTTIVVVLIVILIVIALLSLFFICCKRRKRKKKPRAELLRMRNLLIREEEQELLRQKDEKRKKLQEEALEKFRSFNVDEEFTFSKLFSDEDEFRYCHKDFKNLLYEYIRLREIVPNHNFMLSVNTNKLLENENLHAPLAACIQYEMKFNKKIITNLIYPQNEKGEPIYNPSGKYMVKLYFNGKYRKVIIDNFLPVDENKKLLCFFSGNTNEFWLSLLEKAYKKVDDFFYSLIKKYVFCGVYDITAFTGWIRSRIYLPNSKLQSEKIIKEFMKGNCLIGLLNEIDELYFIVDIEENSEDKKLTMKKWTNSPEYYFKIIEKPFEENEYEQMFIYWNPAMFDYSQSIYSDVGNIIRCLQYKLVVDLDNDDDATLFFHLEQYLNVQWTFVKLIVFNNNDMSHHHSDSFFSMTQTIRIDWRNEFFEMKICPLCREMNILVQVKPSEADESDDDESHLMKYLLHIYSTSKFSLTKLNDLKIPYKETKIVQLGNVYDFQVKSGNGSNYIFIKLIGKIFESKYSEFRTCTLKFTNMDGNCLKENTVRRSSSCCLDLQNVQEGFYKIDISGRYANINLSTILDCILFVSSTYN